MMPAEVRREEANELWRLASVGDLGGVASFLSRGVPVDARNQVGLTPLYGALTAEHFDMVKLLLQAGADPDQTIGEHGEDLPIRYAAARGLVRILELLLDAGAHPDGLARHPGTAIMHAIKLESIEAVTTLINHGATLVGDNLLNNPLEQAATVGNLDIVRLLVQHGAPYSAQAVEIAEQNLCRHSDDQTVSLRLTQVIELLRAAGPLHDTYKASMAEIDQLGRAAELGEVDQVTM